MANLFNTIFYYPLLNALVFLYNTLAFEDFGLAVILLTFLVRLILSPLSLHALKSQRALQEMQPKIKDLQEKYKDNKEALGTATMELYRTHKVNPFSGCLPLLIQIPILIGLYRVSIDLLSSQSLSNLYSFIHSPDALNVISFGFLDISKKNYILAAIAGAAQFIQSRISIKGQKKASSQGGGTQADIQAMMQKQMLYFFPILTIIIASTFPASLGLYWVATTVFSIGEQLIIQRRVR